MVSPRGIGFAVAKALLREGAPVVINGRNEVKLHNAVPK
jgi:NAD(P)-dependent dehydrogenase (short-subunit alcohol dehydrogenase family)